MEKTAFLFSHAHRHLDTCTQYRLTTHSLEDVCEAGSRLEKDDRLPELLPLPRSQGLESAAVWEGPVPMCDSCSQLWYHERLGHGAGCRAARHNRTEQAKVCSNKETGLFRKRYRNYFEAKQSLHKVAPCIGSYQWYLQIKVPLASTSVCARYALLGLVFSLPPPPELPPQPED